MVDSNQYKSQRTFVVEQKNFFIKQLYDKCNFNSYLELGLEHDPTAPYRIINSEKKHSVDIDKTTEADFIMTTDDFFSKLKSGKIEGLGKEEKWDVIFIDADHNVDQVHKDLENSLQHLAENGIILMHDVLPTNYARTLEAPIQINFAEQNLVLPVMNNDAWKVLHYVLKERADLHVCTLIEGDAGLGIIKKAKKERKLLNPSLNRFYKFMNVAKDFKNMMNNIPADMAFAWVEDPYYNF